MAGGVAMRKIVPRIDQLLERVIHAGCRQRLLLILTLVVISSVSLLSTSCQSRFIATSEPITERDLTGIWQARYHDVWAYDSKIGEMAKVTGTETLTLRPDGTYRQVYDDGYGSIKSVDGHRWYLDESNVIHLVDGMWPQLGPEMSALFEEQMYPGVYSRLGKDYRLDTGEVYIPVNSLGGGRIEMSHLPTGDPDSSFVVWFHRVQDQR